MAPSERRGAAPRPVRVPAPAVPGRQGRAQPRRAAPAPPAPQHVPGRHPLDGGGPGADRRGPRPARAPASPSRGAESVARHDEPRTYGHIVVDEAQDLSPMQLRSVARRSLSGSITIVGDIGQATGPWAPASWDEVTAHLPGQRPPAPGRADRELPHARRGGRGGRPGAGRDGSGAASPDAGTTDRGAPALRAGRARAPRRAGGRAVHPGVCATSLRAPRRCWHRRHWWPTWPWRSTPPACRRPIPGATASGAPLSLLPVDLANGLEFDAVVVVEPAAIVEESPQGLRALYVALTRPTRRLVVDPHEATPGRAPGLSATPPARPVACRAPPGPITRSGGKTGAPSVLARKGRRQLGKTP